jgi:alkaline phosphatase D
MCSIRRYAFGEIMNQVSRRQLLAMAAAMGASAAWAGLPSRASRKDSVERRDLYPEGVASGDPDSHSVFLWTRRPFATGSDASVRVEVAEDSAFDRVIAVASAKVAADSDWTCRVLVGNLKPAHIYWYRFIDAEGNASRVGRTITAPLESDARPVCFAFVSCQNINVGWQHAYRRMIYEDERAPAAERLEFVLHLGDFIYEIVWYPEDNPQGAYGRPLREVIRLPQGEKVGAVHVPTTLEDYRLLYRAYLHDPDIQDARARWPFICIWDNHEFSQAGWQSFQLFNAQSRPVQTRKVAANQAWFEYQPARVVKSSGPALERFSAPPVRNAPIEQFDAHGFGDEPNNHAAVGSLTVYRALRWGKHLDLIITDQRSYRSEAPMGRPEAKAFMSDDFPQMIPQEALEILDAGRTYAGGKPPATIHFADQDIPNFRKESPAQTIFGAAQKAWFLQRLEESQATWKVWACSLGTLEYRYDPQNLPVGLTKAWPGAGYASSNNPDHSTAYSERAEIYTHIRNQKITGFATLSGDRHSFWAGVAAASLPPKAFEPVGVAFVGGSISTPGLAENLEDKLKPDHPLYDLYLARRSPGSKPEPAINLLLRHGVRSSLEYQKTGDVERARSLSNRELAPHLSFVDKAGHGYSTVRISSKALECEFVCIPRPIERVTAPDGGPLLYRVVHRTLLWKEGEKPRLEQRVLEGNPKLSL